LSYVLTDGDREIGTLQQPYLQREAYPGAIYLHNGERYAVTHWDSQARRVHIQRLREGDRWTEPVTQVVVVPQGEPLATRTLPLAERRLAATLGSVQAAESVGSYREFARPGRPPARILLQESLEFTIDTTGIWIDVPRELRPTYESLHA